MVDRAEEADALQRFRTELDAVGVAVHHGVVGVHKARQLLIDENADRHALHDRLQEAVDQLADLVAVIDGAHLLQHVAEAAVAQSIGVGVPAR